MTGRTAAGKRKEKAGNTSWGASAAVALVFLGGIAFVAHLVLSDSGGRRKTHISTVTLLKPPPDAKEKPPEPEIRKETLKREEIIAAPEQRAFSSAPGPDSPSDAPGGSDLGVDSEGGSGSDGFGLVGRKGGRALIGSGPPVVGGGAGSRLSLLAKFGWFTRKIQEEVRGLVKKHFDENGGFPKGKHQTTVKIVVDEKGVVVDSRLVASSGNPKVDDAVLQSLTRMRLSQPPPEGMPRGMTLRIDSQG
jgi:TonB family protein